MNTIQRMMPTCGCGRNGCRPCEEFETYWQSRRARTEAGLPATDITVVYNYDGGGRAEDPTRPPGRCAYEGDIVEHSTCPDPTVREHKHVRHCLHDDASWDTCTRGPNNGRAKSCFDCPLRRTGRVVVLDHGGNGIGDGLLGLLAVAGFKAENPDAHVEYRVSAGASTFVALFDGYDDLGVHWKDHHTGETPGAVQLNMGYADGLRDNVPFMDRYCRNAGVSRPVVPTLKNRDTLRRSSRHYAGCIVLAPKSAFRCREWSLHHWQTLVRILKGKGYQPVVVADKELDIGCERLVRPPAERLAGIMLNAACVVGGDSGPAHLSGIMGCRTIVLTGPTTRSLIYSYYPDVTELSGRLDCRGCRWQYPYVPASCDSGCASLQTVLPADVAEAVAAVVPPPGRLPIP